MTFIIFGFLCLTVVGQEKTYIIQRGETLQSIAKKFGVHELRIQEYNRDVKHYYAGVKINLPTDAKQLTPDEIFANDMAHKELTEAKQYLDAGKNKLALNSLKKSLDYKLLDEASFLIGKLYYEKMDYKKAGEHLRLVQDSRTLTIEQQNTMNEMIGYIDHYNAQKQVERADRWRNFGQALAQGLQSTAQQIQAANAYNMHNQAMYGTVPNYNGLWTNPNYQASYEVNKILYDAYADQQKLQSITQSGQQVVQNTIQQVISQYEPPSWKELDEKYEKYVQYNKARGWSYMDKDTYMNYLTNNMGEQMAADQEYIAALKKINDDQRAFNRDISRREMNDRVNNIKMYNDLKTGNYSGNSSYTSSSNLSSATTNTTYTPTNNSTYSTTTSALQQEDATYREQYRNKKVYEDDYRDTKQEVTLYRRDGDKAYADYHQMTVYEKKGQKFILIDNMYYPIESCNWNGFKHYIHYKFRLYLNL